jgi:hypothetical protein
MDQKGKLFNHETRETHESRSEKESGGKTPLKLADEAARAIIPRLSFRVFRGFRMLFPGRFYES